MPSPESTDSVCKCAQKGDDVRLKNLMKEEDFNILETYGARQWNILHFAMSGGHKKCIAAVLDFSKSTTETLLMQKDSLGFSPFRLAKQKGYVEVSLFMESRNLQDKF